MQARVFPSCQTHTHHRYQPAARTKFPGLAPESIWTTTDGKGFGFSPNTNTMDAQSMASKEAEAARQAAAQIMAASRESKANEADATIGDPTKEKGRAGMAGLGWFREREAGKGISETQRSEGASQYHSPSAHASQDDRWQSI